MLMKVLSETAEEVEEEIEEEDGGNIEGMSLVNRTSAVECGVAFDG
jgi:hypothetical protein